MTNPSFPAIVLKQRTQSSPGEQQIERVFILPSAITAIIELKSHDWANARVHFIGGHDGVFVEETFSSIMQQMLSLQASTKFVGS